MSHSAQRASRRHTSIGIVSLTHRQRRRISGSVSAAAPATPVTGADAAAERHLLDIARVSGPRIDPARIRARRDGKQTSRQQKSDE
jgi:hypothetical protein